MSNFKRVCRQKAVDKLTLENSINSGQSRVPIFEWVCRQKAVEWLTLLYLLILLKSFYFCLKILFLGNGMSLSVVDKLTFENSTDSGKSRVPNFKWVCRQKTVEWLTLRFLFFSRVLLFCFSRL